MSSVLTFSEKAKSRLKEIMSSNEHKESKGLRITVKSGGCAGMSYIMKWILKKKNFLQHLSLTIPMKQNVAVVVNRLKFKLFS